MSNIPEGYKQTILGIIPQEWKVKYLGDLCENICSGSNKERNKCGKYHIYGSTGIIGYSNTYSYNYPTILIARVGANAGIINKGEGEYDVSDNTLIVCNNKFVYDYEFAYNQLTNYNLNKLVFGSGQPLVTAGQLKRIKLAVPPMEEQRKIAEILGVWDEAIEKQSRLIEQLELRKRGLMQRLLTGRTRLPGFTTSWQKVKLGEIGKFISGCVFNENEQGGKVGIPFFKVSDMNLCGNEVRMTKSNNYVTQEQIERLNYIVVKEEAIIFAKVGAAIALERKRYAKDFIIDNNMLAYVPDTKFGIWYMKYWFDSIKLSKYIQVGALPSYNASDLAIIKLGLPFLPEQKAIAEVLTAADNEITTRRKKLDALRLQKRGLMQQLLTGKTRVKI